MTGKIRIGVTERGYAVHIPLFKGIKLPFAYTEFTMRMQNQL